MYNAKRNRISFFIALNVIIFIVQNNKYIFRSGLMPRPEIEKYLHLILKALAYMIIALIT
jgi:hypothetical protein